MTTDGAPLHGRAVLVTGGTGFVGSAFVRHAVEQGARVTVLTQAMSDPWRLQPVAGQYHRVTAPLAELPDTSARTIGSVDVMVHLAAAGVNQSFDDANALVETNVAGTLHALQLALRLGVSRFVLAGSSGEYGPGVRIDEDAPLQPTSEYGATRAAATLLARAFGSRRSLDVVVVRPFAVYGPYEPAYRLVPYCVLQGLRGEPLRISSGQQTRDYVHVADAASGIALACTVPEARRGVFNLCTGTETPVKDAAELIARLTGGTATVLAGSREVIPGEMWRTTGSPDRARTVLGWIPKHHLTEGLAQTVEWFRAGGRDLPAYAERREP